MNSPIDSTFVSDAEQLAREAIAEIGYPELSEKFAVIIRYLSSSPAAASRLQKNRGVKVGSAEYINLAAQQFAESRKMVSPTTPSTIPDEMVSFILRYWFGIPEDQLERIKQEHLLSMGAENVVGDLLERYLAEGLEPNGWIWVSGALITGVDFLLPPQAAEADALFTHEGDAKWTVLQVKNRNNSENSSSSHIRAGTDIEKWYRTSSRAAGARWDKFPDSVSRKSFSEEGFKKFVKKYLLDLKKLREERGQA